MRECETRLCQHISTVTAGKCHRVRIVGDAATPALRMAADVGRWVDCVTGNDGCHFRQVVQPM
jgi:hypothetical protein